MFDPEFIRQFDLESLEERTDRKALERLVRAELKKVRSDALRDKKSMVEFLYDRLGGTSVLEQCANAAGREHIAWLEENHPAYRNRHRNAQAKKFLDMIHGRT